MRKKAVMIGLGILVIFLVVILFSKSIQIEVMLTEVVRKPFVQYYKTPGVVLSNKHYQYFQGTITSIKILENQKVKKGETILTYQDYSGKEKNLSASCDGIVGLINQGCVWLYDEDYYISIILDFQRFSAIEEGLECSFSFDENTHLAIVEAFSNMADENGEFEVKLKTNEKLIFRQKVIVSLPILKTTGLTVDKQAVITLENQDYLLSELVLDDLSNAKDYLKKITILLENQQEYLIEGIGIENMSVCVLTSKQKEVLFHDSNR